jgi:zinc protease
VKIIKLIILVICLGFLPLTSAASNPLRIEQFTLSNGMKVIFIPNHRVPAVSHSVWYNVGAADDPYGISGAAHFLEHMMFKGTEKYAPGEFSRIIAKNGGNENAFTGHDFTAFFQNISSENLELVMSMESERIRGLKLDEEQFTLEKSVIIEERKQTRENNPVAQLVEQVDAVMYQNHPYGRPVIGWHQEIKETTKQALRTFYDAHYRPCNATLIVSGDVALETLKDLAEQYYGSLDREYCANNPSFARNRPQEPRHIAARQITVRSEIAKQPIILKKYFAAKSQISAINNPYAAEIFTHIFGNSSTGILYKELVLQQKLATEAYAFYDPLSLDDSDFGIVATPKDGVDIEALKSAMDKVILEASAGNIVDEDIESAKKSLVASEVYAREGLFNIVRILGQIVTTGHDIAVFENWADNISSVQNSDVNAFAKAIFNDNSSVTGVMLPATQEGVAK